MEYNIYESLHTSSKYAEGLYDIYDLVAKEYQTEGRIGSLKAKEMQLYKSFGTNSFSEFMYKLKSWFNSSEAKNDREALKKFSADNLRSFLSKYANGSNALEEQVRLTFDLNKLKNINIKIKDENVFVDEKLSIITKFDSSSIKQEINKYFLKRFNTKNTNMQTVNSFIQSLIAKNALKFEVQTDQTSSSSPIFEESVFIPNYPWGLYAQDIKDIEEEKTGIRFQELQKAQSQIKEIILETLPGPNISAELRQAMQLAWNKNFGAETFSALKFFKGGKTSNFINAVQGSLGEFQATVLFEYLRLKFGTVSSTVLSSIQGNIFTGSEQARTDVQALGEFGIQVKNLAIRSDGRIRDISTTMHPDKFANNYLEGEETTFLGFLANYFFNLTYQQSSNSAFETLEQYLGERLGEVMNMVMSDLVLDTVCFYFVDGQFLIPGSAILEASNSLANRDGLSLKQSVTIYSNYTGKTDEQYEENSEWKNYWINNNGVWETTDKNKTEYGNLISKLISLKTNFNLSELLISQYNVFSA